MCHARQVIERGPESPPISVSRDYGNYIRGNEHYQERSSGIKRKRPVFEQGNVNPFPLRIPRFWREARRDKTARYREQNTNQQRCISNRAIEPDILRDFVDEEREDDTTCHSLDHHVFRVLTLKREQT